MRKAKGHEGFRSRFNGLNRTTPALLPGRSGPALANSAHKQRENMFVVIRDVSTTACGSGSSLIYQAPDRWITWKIAVPPHGRSAQFARTDYREGKRGRFSRAVAVLDGLARRCRCGTGARPSTTLLRPRRGPRLLYATKSSNWKQRKSSTQRRTTRSLQNCHRYGHSLTVAI